MFCSEKETVALALLVGISAALMLTYFQFGKFTSRKLLYLVFSFVFIVTSYLFWSALMTLDLETVKASHGIFKSLLGEEDNLFRLLELNAAMLYLFAFYACVLALDAVRIPIAWLIRKSIRKRCYCK
jgi:cytochrome c oxidase assembly factor CtaG